jgi:predicted peptidase
MRRFSLIFITCLFILATCLQTGFCKNYGSINTSPQIKKYILNVPKNYKDSDPKLPLVVYLHGAGSLNNYTNLQSEVTNIVNQQSNYSFILFAPVIANQDDWSANFQSLKNMLDQIIDQYPVDSTRIYLTGLSMGGSSAWNFAIQNPNLFAAFAPLAGGPLGPYPWEASTLANVGVLKDLPILAFHSKDDNIVPFARTKEIIDALKAAGGNPTLVELEGSEHVILWVYTKKETGIWEWLFSKSKNN